MIRPYLEVRDQCPICLDEVSIGCKISHMPCNHGFHSRCIKEWLAIHGFYPVCRFIMPPVTAADDGGDDSESDDSVISSTKHSLAMSLGFASFC